ncbi:MAG: hypothetical protein NXY57DRAFT_1043886 [Lentinula lateritia]|nr:MAG: hypothetical protein NXY57DRAFT_1043886 [Lentinula lateritia]
MPLDEQLFDPSPQSRETKTEPTYRRPTINWLDFLEMANTVNTIPGFLRRITRMPPIINANQPLTHDAIRTLDTLQDMTRYLLEIPSFQGRYSILEPKWAHIWRCRTPVVDLHNFIFSLADSHEAIPIMANFWILFSTTQYTWAVQQAVTQFLVVFIYALDDSVFIEAFRVAVNEACPGSDLLSLWSTTTVDICGRSLPSNLNLQLVTACQELLLAETTLFFQPIPALNIVHITLTRMYKLWSRCLTTRPTPNVYLENLCFMSVQSLAKISLQLISGGPNWIVKALDAGLLLLLAKTLAWMQASPDLQLDESIHIVFEGIIRMLFLDSVYRPVLRGVRRSLGKLQSQSLDKYLADGELREWWAYLAGEVLSPNVRDVQTVCFRKALHTVCSNEKCNHSSPGDERSQLCKNCLGAVYCSRSCQRLDWKARHRVVCSKLKAKRLTHPQDYSPEDQGMHINELDRFQLLVRALTRVNACRDGIVRSIYAQRLGSSRILIEYDLTVYPWTWCVSDQASSNRLREFLLKSEFNDRSEADTVFAVICPYTVSYSDFFARPVRRGALLDSDLQLPDGAFFRNIDDVLRWI